jgi:hypothetical protein
MAVNIDTVYQKVLAIANKEQRGYITPQEFNLFADKAQNEIYDSYFHDIKMAEMKPKNSEHYADPMEMAEAKLHPFHVDANYYTSSSTLIIPSMYRLIDVTRKGNKVTPTNKSQISYTENHPLTKASLTRSVFVREDDLKLTIYPSPSASTYDYDSDSSGSVDQETFEVSYYKSPSTPNWAYVVVKNKALYNANLSTNFDLHISEEEILVAKILALSGVTLMKPELVQYGGGMEAAIKASQKD